MPKNKEASAAGNISSEKIPTFDESQRKIIKEALKASNGKIYGKDGAAALLGLKPSTLQSKIKKLGID